MDGRSATGVAQAVRMTTASHLAIWHNVWRVGQASVEPSASYGSQVSEADLHELHARLHEASTGGGNDLVVLDHEYAYAGLVNDIQSAESAVGFGER